MRVAPRLMTMRLPVIGVVLATAGIAHTETAPAFVPAKLYAKMFVDGTKIALRGTRGEMQPVPGKKNLVLKTRAFKVTCKVSNVRTGADAIAADVTCDQKLALLGGTYGATATGLFHIDKPAMKIDAATISAGFLVMPASPQVGVVKATEKNNYDVRTTKHGTGICRVHQSHTGDAYMTHVCFAKGQLTELHLDDGSSFPDVVDLKR